jgi:hypothetical protein
LFYIAIPHVSSSSFSLFFTFIEIPQIRWFRLLASLFSIRTFSTIRWIKVFITSLSFVYLSFHYLKYLHICVYLVWFNWCPDLMTGLLIRNSNDYLLDKYKRVRCTERIKPHLQTTAKLTEFNYFYKIRDKVWLIKVTSQIVFVINLY